MRQIRYIVLFTFLLSVLPASSQNAINSKLLSCNAIETKGTLFLIDNSDKTVDLECKVDFHYNLKSQLFPEGGWYLRLYCPQMDIDEIEQCGRSDVNIKKDSKNFGKNRGKPIEITIGPNELASLWFLPSLSGNYAILHIYISGHDYAIAVKDCTFVKVGNHKREKIELEYTKATLSDILNTWFNYISTK